MKDIKENVRVNERIRAKKIRVIDHEGKQVGILSLEEALKKAEEYNLDLVEVSPKSEPPVCRIMDYGKYKYMLNKKAQEARKKQSVVQIKEIKLRPKTDAHDIQFKIKHIKRFLEDGAKAKVTIIFRGREITHPDIGKGVLQKIYEEVKNTAALEQEPRLEGRNMVMILSPVKKVAGC